MTTPSLALPLANHQVFRSQDFDETRAFLGTKGLGFDAAKGKPVGSALDARINAVYLPNMYISYVQYDVPVALSAAASRGDYGIYLPIRGRIESTIGDRTVACEHGGAVVASPLRAQTTRSTAECGRYILSMSRDAMTRQLSALLGEGIAEALVFEPAMDLIEGDGRTLMDTVRLAARDLDRDGSMFWNPIMAAMFEQWVMTGLLLSQPHNYRDALEGRDRSVAPKDVAKALDYMEANLHLPITLGDIVAASGVPGRTLYKHFRDSKGVSPLAYLRKARFERARQEFLRCSGDVTVTEIACRWSFDHLGRFSVEYRKRFGESPSETIARRRQR